MKKSVLLSVFVCLSIVVLFAFSPSIDDEDNSLAVISGINTVEAQYPAKIPVPVLCPDNKKFKTDCVGSGFACLSSDCGGGPPTIEDYN